jgi:hypothetical protein
MILARLIFLGRIVELLAVERELVGPFACLNFGVIFASTFHCQKSDLPHH